MLRRVNTASVPVWRRLASHASRGTATRKLFNITNRCSSSSTRQSSDRDSPATVAFTFGALAVGAFGFYTVSHDLSSTATPVPSASVAAHQNELVVIECPVKAYSLREANAKIREQATSFVFNVHNGGRGRADVVRVSSNNPVEDEWALAVAPGVGGNETLYAGVYDGHAGWATSAVLKQALIPCVSNTISRVATSSNNALIDSAIKAAFRDLDARIMHNAQVAAEGGCEPGSGDVIAAIAAAVSGSCALLSMFDTTTPTVRTAVTGDSRAVLGSWSTETDCYVAEELSVDQTGFNPEEVKRLKKNHPGEIDDIVDPNTGRLLGMAVTRGFGDHIWKLPEDALKYLQANYYGLAPRPKYKSPPYMTAEPEVTTRKVTTKDFVILASDGLWDVISNDDAVACVSRWLACKKSGKAETVNSTKSSFTVSEDGWPSYKATPEFFAIEDLDNAAVCLVKNALGGSRRSMFCGSATAYSPISRYVRDDMTVQVIFFHDPYTTPK